MNAHTGEEAAMSGRTMSEREAQFTLGKLIDDGAQKDAIHIAVAPVTASQRLAPGQHVGLTPEGTAGSQNPIGIVDPFLEGPVFKGELFWMFLYPNTITSLRHQWRHPAFDGETISQADHREKSLAWIKGHAEDLGLSADAIMANAETWLQYEDHTIQQDSERWRDHFNATEFWHHYEIVTGKVVEADKKTSFYCCTC